VIVVDASVAVQWIVPEAESDYSEAVLSLKDLIAPELLQVEVANALRRKIAVSDITLEQARQGYALIAKTVSLRPLSAEWLHRALELAVLMAHPIYDCIYLVLAEQTRTRLVTRDRELAARAAKLGLGNFVATLPLTDPR
jgi:predicted nucleic acid-binding protein